MPMSGICENTHAYCKSVSRSSETSANEKGTEPIRANKFEEFSTIEKGIAVQEAKCTLRTYVAYHRHIEEGSVVRLSKVLYVAPCMVLIH